MHSFPWYETTGGQTDSLQQGDLIKGCPILTPSSIIVPASAGTSGNQAQVDLYDVVVMSQSCDIIKSRPKVTFVVVCSYITFKEWLSKIPPTERAKKEHISKFFNSLRSGLQPNFHLLNRSPEIGIDDYLVVNFRLTFSLHIDYLSKHALSMGDRVRLIPPYREQLSQAFAKFFMRVGLPQDIPDADYSSYL